MNLDEAVNFLLSRVNGPVRIGTPLGLGKPNPFLNRLYGRMRADPARGLEIYSALSLDPPRVKGLLAENFFGPFAKRHFGEHYPRLSYVSDLLGHKIPEHIRVFEFFVQAGLYKNNPRAQADYVSLNYTHVVANLIERGVNCIAQLVARGPDGRLSLSCNPDLTLDLVDQSAARGRPLVKIAVVHDGLPFLGGPAAVPADYFDLILEGPEHAQELFAIPRMPFEDSDHLIGLHASQLPMDDGTLQIGIGALAEALSYSLILRHRQSPLYRSLIARLPNSSQGPALHHAPFTAGLYGMSEMVMDSFMHLREAGILTREVQNKKSPHPRYLHGGFFLGSKPFYAWLKNLSEKDRRGISMTRISKINDLYDEDEAAVRAQRKNARFFNSTMQVSLLGEALSDTLQDGRVISGVGGQYNFVAMSRELPDAYSTLLLRSTWHDGKRRRSNIVMHGGHVTIPRHLRDLVITEYGIANLRGKTDQECVQALICIADAEFQDELLASAKKALKVSAAWRIPESARRNTPANIKAFLEGARALDPALYPDYPFGSDFTPVEQRIFPALARLKGASAWEKIKLMADGLRGEAFPEEMARMKLARPCSMEARLNKLALKGALTANR